MIKDYKEYLNSFNSDILLIKFNNDIIINEFMRVHCFKKDQYILIYKKYEKIRFNKRYHYWYAISLASPNDACFKIWYGTICNLIETKYADRVDLNEIYKVKDHWNTEIIQVLMINGIDCSTYLNKSNKSRLIKNWNYNY